MRDEDGAVAHESLAPVEGHEGIDSGCQALCRIFVRPEPVVSHGMNGIAVFVGQGDIVSRERGHADRAGLRLT
ncbi:hypothetical protein D3C85_1384900 [compost metagenome]